MKEYKLPSGETVLVDDEDYEKVSRYHWYIRRRKYVSYARRIVIRKGVKYTEFMHRLIMDCPDGMYIDHINHNGLDNRKENLRICTNMENSHNQVKHKPTTLGMIKGVSISPCIKSKPYKAHISCNGKAKDIGYYATIEEAALAYDKKALELFGQYAQLNSPLILR